MERDTRSFRRQMTKYNAARPERPLTLRYINNVPTLVDRGSAR